MTTAFIASNTVRVLGALIEKELTTPEYYPMTLNALTNACNQKSNRSPVLMLTDGQVLHGFEEARTKGLARAMDTGTARTIKYRQRFIEALQLTPAQTAVVCELMLRGAQTLGELRQRAERMHPFESLADVETALTELASDMHTAVIITQKPLVVKLPRQAGQKEARYAHTLCGDVIAQESSNEAVLNENESELATRHEEMDKRIITLEHEAVTLKNDLATLQETFAAFRRQLE
jgi:uncharacterized protein